MPSVSHMPIQGDGDRFDRASSDSFPICKQCDTPPSRYSKIASIRKAPRLANSIRLRRVNMTRESRGVGCGGNRELKTVVLILLKYSDAVMFCG